MIIVANPGFIKQNFIGENYSIVDTSLTSPNYFDITFFPEYIGGGISLVKLRGNSLNLISNNLTEVEVLDSQGDPVRHEIPTFRDRFNNFYISIYVYDNTAPGVGSISIVGLANRDLNGNPVDPTITNSFGYNLLWTRPIAIYPYERNNSELAFDDPPYVSVSQVVTPARLATHLSGTGSYSAITSSNLSIVTSDFKGFDKKTSTSKNIGDKKVKQLSKVLNTQPITINSVDTNTREVDKDIWGGFRLNEVNRYNTVLQSSTDFFSSSYSNGLVEFFTESYNLSPSIPSGYNLNNTNPYNELTVVSPATQSLQTQLSYWSANIVKIKDARTAYLDQPVQVNADNAGTNNRSSKITHTYKNVTNFTASLLYLPSGLEYTTSSIVSQSYVQFTFQDLNPIGGQVYKIRAFYRRGSEVGDWTLINDQIIRPAEYLTDARYPNQTNYGSDISDFYLIGHFINESVLDNNWQLFNEQITTFDTATGSINNEKLVDGVKLTANSNVNKVLTTTYYQNYPGNQIFSLTFNCILDPYTELEVYGNSTALQTTVFSSDPFPRAFDSSLNKEPLRYNESLSRVGKLIGRIKNDTANVKNYNRVVFDFETDREGLGRPLMRVKQTNTNYSGSAYVGEISVTPRQLNGFTPSIVQFAIPASQYGLDANFTPDFTEYIDFKLEYFDYTGNQSEYVTYLEDVLLEQQTEIPTNACQAEQLNFNFNAGLYNVCTNIDKQTDTIPSSSTLTYANPGTNKFYPEWEHQTDLLNALYQLSNFIGNFTNATSVWNALRPTMSISTEAATGFDYVPQWNSQTINLDQGRITSSWNYVDSFTTLFTGTGGPITYEQRLYNFAYTQSHASIIDSRSFVAEGGLGITYLNVSNSYYSFSNAVNNNERTEALKKRRLYWPTTPSASANYFTENGGIYNVKFKLKKYTGTGIDYYPQTGSYMRVYIFDVSSSYTTQTTGTKGWYPPDQNIVKIGHGYTLGSTTTPLISWYDSSTGYYYDEYDINLVQYGSPAQLVFEPAGDNGTYFGTIIDDIQFCKIGVTTDPYFIKPQTVADKTKKVSGEFVANLPREER
jgi:hypothetical protein